MTDKLFTAVFLVTALVGSDALAYVDGIDVSRWQGNINWNAVKNNGIDFAFAKATEGVDYIDPKYHANMVGATAAGVHIGPYHFARLDSLDGVPFTQYDGSPFVPGTAPYIDAVSEANDFLDAITPYYDSGLYLPPVADVEQFPDFGSATLLREFVSNWVQLFSDTINDELGRRPIIYASKYGANTRYTPAIAESHDLWLAWWKGTGTSNPPVSSDTPLWNDWKFWQYTASGSVAGISGDVDRDVFDGTPDELEQLLIGFRPEVPGDIDGDGDVDEHDLTRWQADFGDGTADGASFLTWQRNYPTPSAVLSPVTALTTVVPEPTSVLLLLVGTLVVGGARQRH